jgi:cytochrome c peroxidase
MLKHVKVSCGLIVALGGCGMAEDAVEESGAAIRSTGGLEPSRNPAGIAETVHTTGAIDRTNPFFQVLGPNPRTCETCHGSGMGWTLTAKGAAKLFKQSEGLDPLFMLHDAGNRPDADISTRDARLASFSTLIEKGLIRFARTVPATAEFTVTAVEDPHGFATPTRLVNFRRPTHTANEAKVAMTNNAPAPQPDIRASLAGTVRGAAQFHGQRDPATPVPTDQQFAAADMQLGIFFAQSIDEDAGRLDDDGAMGGPFNLRDQTFYVGINDIQGNDPITHTYTSKIFNLFDAWERYDNDRCGPSNRARKRAAIWRGQEIFNNKQFDMSGVSGLNDQLAQPVVHGTCGTCHNSPNVGGHSVYRLFDIGTADEPNCASDLPILTLQHKTMAGVTRRTCDMGRGGGSGLWIDVGKFRAHPLRGLAARAPYFHDGQAKTVKDVIQYHDRRFNIGLSHRETQDLEAFLNAL